MPPVSSTCSGKVNRARFAEAAAVLRNDQPRPAGFGAARTADFTTSLISLSQDTDSSVLVMEVGIDISEQKAAKQEVRDLNVELEKRVLDRTAALAETNKNGGLYLFRLPRPARPLRAIDGFSKCSSGTTKRNSTRRGSASSISFDPMRREWGSSSMICSHFRVLDIEPCLIARLK